MLDLVSEVGVRAQLSASVVGGICPISCRTARVACVVSVDASIDGVEFVGFGWSDGALKDACPSGSFVVVRPDCAISNTNSNDWVSVSSIGTVLLAPLSTVYSKVTNRTLSHASPALAVSKCCPVHATGTVIDTPSGRIVRVEIRRRWTLIHTEKGVVVSPIVLRANIRADLRIDISKGRIIRAILDTQPVGSVGCEIARRAIVNTVMIDSISPITWLRRTI